MAADTDTKDTGLKKAVQEALNVVQGRFKDVEKIWNDAFEQLNTRFNEVGNDAREFVKKVEGDGRKRYETVRDQLKVDDLVGRFKTSEIIEQGQKLTGDTIDRLGLATAEELKQFAVTLDKVANKLETVRKRAAGSPTQRSFNTLKARVDKLEKALAAIEKGAPAKKPAARKTTARKTTARKKAAPKTVAKA